MSRYRITLLTHKNPISVDPSIPNSLESIRFAPISVEPPHTPPSHPPPTIALPLYTLTPEPTPITTLAAPTAPPSRTNHSMIDAPYRRVCTLSRPLINFPNIHLTNSSLVSRRPRAATTSVLRHDHILTSVATNTDDLRTAHSLAHSQPHFILPSLHLPNHP